MQVIPSSLNGLSTSSSTPQLNVTSEQRFNSANPILCKQSAVNGPVSVPSALTSVYSKLHKYAFEGKKTKLKKLLKDNKDWINVDIYDIDGYTALYLACLNKHKNCVRVLLEEGGAKPNEPCRNGETCVHAAAMSGSVSTLRLLLEYGGNINLEDNDGRSAKHYAMFKNPNANTRRKMLYFIEEIKFNNLTSTNTPGNNTIEHRRHRSHTSPPPIINMASANIISTSITSKKPTISSSIPPPPPPMTMPLLPTHTTTPLANIKSATALNTNNNNSNNSLNENLELGGVGVTVMLQCINESSLLHDITGTTINNGSFMVYEAMKLRENHLVSIKRLHSKVAEGGNVSLLINELNAFRHRINNFPKILTLMGFCQTSTNSGDNNNGNGGLNMVLMFERIALGSLFYILHEIKLARKPKLKSITSIMLNVCDALIYLHEKGLIHCYVNSHSVFLTHQQIAKLGNLEYSFDKLSIDSKKQLDKRPKISENRYRNCVWNWLAPELMQCDNKNNNEQIPNESSDMYGFCVVIWELFNTSIPWDGLKWTDIYQKVVEEHETLHVDFNLIPLPFSRIIKDGFSLNSMQRMRFDEVKVLLETYQQSLNEERKLRVAQKRIIRNNNASFSEGIENIKKIVTNDNGMSATLNSSIEELDKFSQFSSNDNVNRNEYNGEFIYCDAYKTEVHLTNKKNTRSRSLNTRAGSNSNVKSTVLKQQPNNSNNNNSNKLKQSSSNHHKQKQQKPKENFYKNQCTENEIKRDSTDDDANKNKKSYHNHKTTTPPPPPPPLPPPPPSMLDKTSLTKNTQETISKLNQHLVDDPLPPTPPPSITQLQKKFKISNTNITPSPLSTNKCNLPLPPTFIYNNTNTTPSKYQAASSMGSNQQSSQFCSKSVDSPRTPLNQTTLNNYINNNNKNTSIGKSLKKVCSDSNDQEYNEVNIDDVIKEKEARSSSIIRKSELFEKIVARLERKNSSINDSNRYSTSPANNKVNENNENMDELDTSLSLLKRDRFKLLENLYRLDASVISPSDKEKLFNLIQQRQQIRTQDLLKQHQQQLGKQDFNGQSGKDFNNNLTEKLQNKEEEERKFIFNANLQKFDQFQNNLLRPTPDDKKRFYLPTNKSIHLNTPINHNKNVYTITPLNNNKLDSKIDNWSNIGGSMLINSGESMLKTAIANTSALIQTPPTNKKLDLSTISQEDNTRYPPVPPSPHYHHLKQQNNNNGQNESNITQQDDNQQRISRRTSPNIASATTGMLRSQSLTNTNNQRILNVETAEAIAVSTKSGLLSSIKALSKESLNSSTHLMDTQEFYQLASRIKNNSDNNNKCHEECNQNIVEHHDDSQPSKSNKKENKLSLVQEKEKELVSSNNIPIKNTNRIKSNSLSIDLLPPQSPSHGNQHHHHLHSPSTSGSIPINNLKQQHQQRTNHNLEILNGGSVKSLVQSYEEFPHKEVNSVDSKIIQMREERQKELESVVEQSRNALNSELMVENNPNEEGNNFCQELDDKRRAMQKELSTISEKTEYPSPPDKNSIKNKIISPANPSHSTTINSPNKLIHKPVSNSSTNNIISSLSCTASALASNNSNKTANNNNNNNFLMTSSVTSTKPIRNNNLSNLDLTLNSNSQATILNQRFTLNDLNSTTGTNTTATLTNATINTIKPRHTLHQQQHEQQGLVSTTVQTQTISSQNKNKNFSYKNQLYNPSNSSDEEDENDDDDEEYSSSGEYDDEDSNYCEHCEECDLKNNNKKAATIYSSQEDFINSLRSSAEECLEDDIYKNIDKNNHVIVKNSQLKKNDSPSLIECSEAVFLNDFDKLAFNCKPNSSKSIHNQHGIQVKENGSPAILLSQYPTISPKSQHENNCGPQASHKITSQQRQKPNDNCGTVTASIGLGPNQMVTNTYPRPNNANYNNSTKSPMYRNFSVEPKTSISSTSSSLYSNATPATQNSSEIPPPPPPLPSDIFNKSSHGFKLNSNKNSQQHYSNVRLDKHIIDTSKFKGYSYKLETRSNVTNQYHIKSLLTNEQTGHQLLLANTKVKTPNIQTKVIIDQ